MKPRAVVVDRHPLRWFRVRWRPKCNPELYPFGLRDWQGIGSLCGSVRAGRVVVDAGSRSYDGDKEPVPLACYIDNKRPAPTGPGGLHMKPDNRTVPMTPEEFAKRWERRARNRSIVDNARLVEKGGRSVVALDPGSRGVAVVNVDDAGAVVVFAGRLDD